MLRQHTYRFGAGRRFVVRIYRQLAFVSRKNCVDLHKCQSDDIFEGSKFIRSIGKFGFGERIREVEQLLKLHALLWVIG